MLSNSVTYRVCGPRLRYLGLPPMDSDHTNVPLLPVSSAQHTHAARYMQMTTLAPVRHSAAPPPTHTISPLVPRRDVQSQVPLIRTCYGVHSASVVADVHRVCRVHSG